jgi:hypothetical protein
MSKTQSAWFFELFGVTLKYLRINIVRTSGRAYFFPWCLFVKVLALEEFKQKKRKRVILFTQKQRNLSTLKTVETTTTQQTYTSITIALTRYRPSTTTVATSVVFPINVKTIFR